jgi:hypothetical protein
MPLSAGEINSCWNWNIENKLMREAGKIGEARDFSFSRR